MRYTGPTTDSQAPPRKKKRRPFGVLIVDDEASVREVLGEALRGRNLRIHEASTLAEARSAAEHEPIDLVLVDLSLPDGDGLDLTEELKRRDPAIESIVITGGPSVPRAVKAIRAGVGDFLTKPLNLGELNQCVGRALQRRVDARRTARRVHRLRRLCKKLNRARNETTEQVDLLCGDLVNAYQELAGQMKHVQLTAQFRAMIEQELDLEQLLRRALEFVLQHLGPTNAVIFLPGGEEGFTVGGYINYTFDRSAADALLDHLAALAAGRIAEGREVQHLTGDAELDDWLGGDIGPLGGSHVVAFPCWHDDEMLASVMLFRDGSDPYDAETSEAMAAVGSALAAQLTKVVSIHHRHHANPVDLEDFDDDGGVAF